MPAESDEGVESSREDPWSPDERPLHRKIDERLCSGAIATFEGKAEAVSTSNHLQYLVPNLVEAMFTGFPGNSGETVRISVAPEKKRG